MEDGDEERPRKHFCKRYVERLPQYLSQAIEHFFYQLGFKIAQRPIKCLAGCITIILICLSGLYFFRYEKNPLKLWVPPNSDFIHDTEWLMTQFGEGVRQESLIITADNVLDPKILIKLNEITKQVLSAQTSNKVSWNDVCLKVPTISGITHKTKRSVGSGEDDFFDLEPAVQLNRTAFEPAVHVDPKLYCNIVNSLPKACLLYSILDIWEFDSDLIKNLSKKNIIAQLNQVKISPTLGHPINFTELLAGVERDNEGRIISAKAVETKWMVHINFSEVDMDTFGNDAGTDVWATEDVLNWELTFLNVLKENENIFNYRKKEENQSISIFYEAGRSFGDETSTAMFQDMDKLALGLTLMFIYVLTILSEYNWVEIRFCLTSTGLMCVGGAFIIAIGVCSILGIPYGPVHTSLPFLLLGLGVDDIFVMMTSWREVHVSASNRNKPLPERIGLMLAHAGSAICITSLTDVVAFIIGASTILPSLQSFCTYAAVGVLVTFLLQITFFVAFFTLDVQRIQHKRNGVLSCIVHKNFVPKFVDSEKTFSSKLISCLYPRVILTRPGKVIIILITIVTTSFGIVGSLQLQQWFDPKWFLSNDTYLSNFYTVRTLYFPNEGFDAVILIGDINYTTEFPKLVSLSERFENLSTVESIDPWPKRFEEFVFQYYEIDLKANGLEPDKFNYYLSKFLFSQKGGKYQANFRFDGNLTCGQNTPRILAATVDFTFRKFINPRQWIFAMDESIQLAKQAGIDGFTSVWSTIFSVWSTDKLIGQEVLRNVILAIICVMGMTGALIAELQTCFWILLCVLLTLVDVCGFMFYWGLTVDITSCIVLELAIGLSVDYAAHVAHTFVNTPSRSSGQGRTERTLISLRHIGVAVAYGAGSTLLALSMMALSNSYVFRTFFKIFFLVIVFGIWHGLILLPVVLSTIGPKSIRSQRGQKPYEEYGQTEMDLKPFRDEGKPEN